MIIHELNILQGRNEKENVLRGGFMSTLQKYVQFKWPLPYNGMDISNSFCPTESNISEKTLGSSDLYPNVIKEINF